MDTHIVTIYPSDIISESMNKINFNFELLANKDDVADARLETWYKELKSQLDNVRNSSDERITRLGSVISDMDGKLDGMSSSAQIQDAINAAINNASQNLQDFIQATVGQQVNEALAGYAVDSMLTRQDLESALSELEDSINGRINGLDYVHSATFLEFEADAKKRTAEANLIAANSTFYKVNGHLVYLAQDGGDSDDSRESPYTDLEDWYENGLTQEQKNTVNGNTTESDPLDDPEVLKRLKELAERTFQTVHLQLATISVGVDPTSAYANIIATVKNTLNQHGDDAEDITAAIFVTANQEGSEIILKADRLNFEGYQFDLTTDEIRIDSDYFKVNKYGQIQASDIYLSGSVEAHNMKAYDLEVERMSATDVNITNLNATHVIADDITATNISLISKDGYTRIDSNGILYAHGAQIDGDVTAKRFQASENVAISTTDGYSGTVTKSTAITGSTFGMVVNGTLTNGNNTRDLTENSLYIELVDELPNDGGGDIQDSVLYGVPVLCMKYRTLDGVQHVYRLKPGSWMGDSAADSSKFRWYQQYGTDVLKYSFNSYSLGTYTNKYYTDTLSSNFPGTFYIFSPQYRNTFVTGGDDIDTIYRLRVDSFGNANDADTRLNNMKTYNLVDSNSVTVNTVNDHTVYALKSRIDSRGGTTYCGEAVGSTPITTELCSTYQGYLQNTISAGVRYGYNDTFTSISNQYGVSHIFDYILRAAGAKTTGGSVVSGNDIWQIEGFLPNTTRADIKGTEGLVNNVPFTNNGFYTRNGNTIGDQEFSYSVSVYPMTTITNTGRTSATTTNMVYAKCTFGVFGNYNHNYSGNNVQADAPIKCIVGPYTKLVNNMYDNNYHTDGEFIPEAIELTLSFDCIFQVNNMSMNPLLSTTEDEILTKMFNFLSTYTFEGNLVANSLNTHVQFDGTITGKFTVRNDYNSFDTYNVVLTKNTVY